MKNETRNALLEYIMEVNKSIRYVATNGCGADLGPLAEKTARLYDALQNEPCSDHDHYGRGEI